MSDRARRDRKSKLDKLAEYKRAREGGGRNYKVGVLNLVEITRIEGKQY